MPGTGTVVTATYGAGTMPISRTTTGSSLGLIALDQADNLALGWIDAIEGDAAPGLRVKLVSIANDIANELSHPSQVARYVPLGVTDHESAYFAK